MSEVNVWEALHSAIENRIKHASFTTCFKPIAFIGIDSATIHLGVPDHVFEDWILNNYRDVIDESLDETSLSGYSIRFEVAPDSSKTNLKMSPRRNTGSLSETAAPSSLNTPVAHAPAPMAAPVARGMALMADSEISELPLNPKYSFETFVVGSSNQFAHAAALAVADSP